MADNSVVTALTDQPSPALNGTSRPAANTAGAPVPPTSVAPAAEVIDPPTPYSYQPEVLAEHALLGSLMYAPGVLVELETFLRARDFSSPSTRAVFATLRGLHASGALFDVATMPTEAQRMDAANENRVRLFTALRAKPSPFTSQAVKDLPKLLNDLAVAAPVECLPFRGVYDPSAQVRLGRMVLEDSCRRQLQSMGVLLRRSAPLVTPARHHSAPEVRQAENLTSHLEVIQAQLRSMTDRLVAATRRTGPDATAAAAHLSRRPDSTAAQMVTPPWRLPAPLRMITQRRLHRAELQVIHLALHSGRMDRVPQEILALRPDDFSHPRHANAWRAIQDLRAQGLPVNYVSVFYALRGPAASQPALSDRALLALATSPDQKPEWVAAALATVTTAGLTRAAKSTSHAMVAIAAAGPALSVPAALDHLSGNVAALAERAATAGSRHRATTPPPAAHTPAAR